MLAALNAATGLDVSRETITSDGESLGRPHMAEILMDNDIVPSIQAAFDEYLADGTDCFVPMERIDSEFIIEAVHSAGGIA